MTNKAQHANGGGMTRCRQLASEFRREKASKTEDGERVNVELNKKKRGFHV